MTTTSVLSTPVSADYHLPTWKVTDRGTYRHECMAWLPDELLAPKISSFISAHDGKLLEASPDEFHILLGKRQLFSLGGKNVVPIEADITIRRSTECVRHLTHVTIELTPRGHVADREAYDQRCAKILIAFRESIMALNLERRFADRSPVHTGARVWPIVSMTGDLKLGDPIHVECYNVGNEGLAFWIDEEFDENEIYLRYGDPSSTHFISQIAEVTHRTTTEDGRRLYGVHFLNDNYTDTKQA